MVDIYTKYRCTVQMCNVSTATDVDIDDIDAIEDPQTVKKLQLLTYR